MSRHYNFVYKGWRRFGFINYSQQTVDYAVVYMYEPVEVSTPMDPAEPLPGISLSMYLELNGESYSGFARRVPCHPSYPRMLALGLASPSYSMAVRIEQITDGMVPRSRWFPPEPPAPKVDIGDI